MSWGSTFTCVTTKVMAVVQGNFAEKTGVTGSVYSSVAETPPPIVAYA